jgi:hypothetical protein
LGRSFRETDLAEADLGTIVHNMISGEYRNPLRVIAFNTVEGWSRDVSEEIAFCMMSGGAWPRQAGARANIRFMFQAMVTRLHSPRTFSSPRRKN